MRYAELLPQELDRWWSTNPIAIWPIGALEWHGPHLPLGLDGIVAERFAEGLAERVSGVLLPTCWLPITTLPHRHSLQVRTEAFRMIVDDQIEGFYKAGARSIAIVTGHYAQGHELELYDAAERAMALYNDLFVAAATPLEVLERDDLLDHAGHWEASQLLLYRPDLVHLAELPDEISPRDHAVLGDHPRHATAAEAERLLTEASERWTRLLNGRSRDHIHAFYERRRAGYQSYKDRFYRDSWERAINDWWAESVGGSPPSPDLDPRANRER